MRIGDESCAAEVLLFQRVRNAGRLKDMVTSNQLDAAIFNAQLVIDIFPVQMAVSSAVERESLGCLKCRGVNAEVVYNLSGQRNISKALATFGIDENATSVLATILSPTFDKVSAVRNAVEGDELLDVPKSLQDLADEQRIIRTYGITAIELGSSTLVDSIVTRIACRDVS